MTTPRFTILDAQGALIGAAADLEAAGDLMRAQPGARLVHRGSVVFHQADGDQPNDGIFDTLNVSSHTACEDAAIIRLPLISAGHGTMRE